MRNFQIGFTGVSLFRGNLGEEKIIYRAYIVRTTKTVEKISEMEEELGKFI